MRCCDVIAALSDCSQLEKLFFLFPDPHFKKKTHRRRVISPTLLSEYAYTLCIGGVLYTITDVEELHVWMDSHLAQHPLFVKLTEEELVQSRTHHTCARVSGLTPQSTDPCVPLVCNSSEESRKVDRNNGKKFLAVYRRIAPPAS
jgi:tRNA (guanine-N7-)-methyltransferase